MANARTRARDAGVGPFLAVLKGGRAWAWDSPQSVGAFTFGGLLLVAFVFAERRAAEPILPL